MKMVDDQYPSLYVLSNDAAINSQSELVSILRWNSIALIAASALSLFSQDSVLVAFSGFLFFSASLGVYLYGRHRNLQNVWYQSRALAESIKTMTWRYIMKAPPFISDVGLDAEFSKRISALFAENRGLGSNLAGKNINGQLITPGMRSRRRWATQNRLELYRLERIDDQKAWYAEKAIHNKRQSRRWFWVVVALHVSAIVLMVVRVANPSLKYLPIELSVVCASCAITWTQFRKYDELASAYTLAGIDIGAIEADMQNVSCDDDLAAFVGNAENAFSREHTQWLARKDLS